MPRKQPPPDPIVPALEEFVRRVRPTAVTDERAATDPAAGRESPAFSRAATLTLIVLGVDAALVFTLAEDLLQQPIVNVLTKVLPFLFGAYFVAALEKVRNTLQRWCAAPAFRMAVVVAAVFFGAVHMLNFFPVDLRVANAASGMVEVDGVQRQIRGDVLFGAPLGFRRQRIVSRDQAPTGTRVDSVEVGFSDRLRATRLAAATLGPYAIDIGNTYSVTVHLDAVSAQRPELLVTGRFARSFLRRVEGVLAHSERPAHPFQPLRWGPAGTRDSAVVSFALNRMPGSMQAGSSTHIPLPAGTYTVRLVDGDCAREAAPLRVTREVDNEVTLGLRPCGTSR